MASVIPIFLDLETYWSQTHSLTKMNPIVYAQHPETEVISLAYKIGDGQTNVVFGEKNVALALSAINWSDKLAIAHNMSGFDAMILAWRFGIKPKMWGCTLAMARPIHAKTTGLSLANLVAHYGLGIKDATALMNTKGRHLADFTADEVVAMRTYNQADTDQCAGLFRKLVPLTSKREMKLIDMTIRMLVERKFVLDTSLLRITLREEQARKKAALIDLASSLGLETEGLSEDEIAAQVSTTLGSSIKFSELLRTLGEEVPMKRSPATGKDAPALAKTDPGFVALTESSNPLVAAAAAARLGVKSTLLETRITSFLSVGAASDGRFPVPINYYGADTTGRDSGGMSLNAQNLPRINPKMPKPTDALRLSLVAPKGHRVVVADLSGIELRVNMFLWKVPYAMKLFQNDPEKADLYRYFASNDLYHIAESDVTKDQRQIGKICHLGLGFGAGPATFVRIAKTMGGIDMELPEAHATVGAYRTAHPQIVRGWRVCGASLKNMRSGEAQALDPWGMCYTTKDGITTPQGWIRYPNLREEEIVRDAGSAHERTETAWMYGHGRHKAFLTGPKIVENIVQHLAREVVMDNALAVKKQTGYGTAHRVHDELIYVVPESEADDMLTTVQGIMRTPPTWWPELITWSEGDVAHTYGAAK